MAYEKHIWETGQVITADKLNNIQDCLEEVNGDVEVAEGIVASRGRNAIIDLTPYPIGSESVTIPGINETVANLIKKNYIVFLKLGTADTFELNRVVIMSESGFSYVKFAPNTDPVVTSVVDDTFSAGGFN